MLSAKMLNINWKSHQLLSLYKLIFYLSMINTKLFSESAE